MFSVITRCTQSRGYYLWLSLLMVPIHALQWWLSGLLVPDEMPTELMMAVSLVIFGFPAIVCCVLHLWVRRAALLSWGSLWVCVLLPLVAGILTTFGAIKLGVTHSGSMAGIVVVLSAIANLIFSILLLSVRGFMQALTEPKGFFR